MEEMNTNINLQENLADIQVDNFNKNKKRYFKDLGWYVKRIKWIVLVLACLEILTHVMSAIIPVSEFIMMNIINPLLLIVDLVIFGWITIRIAKKERSKKQALITVFLTGFGIGLIMSLFKFLWVRQFWTLINIIIEPVYMGLLALVVGMVVILFIKKRIIN